MLMKYTATSGHSQCRIFLHDYILAKSTSALVPRSIARNSRKQILNNSHLAEINTSKTLRKSLSSNKKQK